MANEEVGGETEMYNSMESSSDSRKRPLSDAHEQHFANKRSNNGFAADHILLKQLIPSAIAGIIIGKGGEAITKLQSETGTVIKMSKSGDFYPATTDRVCVITGYPDNVKSAHNTIWERIRDRYDRSNEDIRTKIVVPNVTVGMIIGKGGCYVKQIKDETGANVQISQKSHDTMLVERVVTINGSTEQAVAAFDMVYKMIVEDPQSGSCPNISYSDFRGPIANANPTGSPFANSMNMMDMSGKGMMNHMATDALKSTLRGSGYSLQASEEITNAMCTLANYGLLGGPGPMGINSIGAAGANVGGLSLEYLAVILSGNKGQGGRDGGYGSYGGGSFHQDKLDLPIEGNMSMGGKSFHDGSYGNSYGGASNNNSFGLGPGMRGSTADMDQQPDTTKELQVNENLVGAILGPGGRGIVEIQKITTANIQITKKGVFAPGTRNRVVTVSGSSGAVERALFMVQQCIQQEENKRTRQEQMLKF